MARESQGLQIALILFVTLALVLGGTTWVFYQKSTDLEKRAGEEKTASEKARQDAAQADEKAKELSKLVLGPGASDKLEDVQKHADKDLKIAGVSLKPEEQFYSPAIKKLGTILAAKDEELKNKNVEIAGWEKKYKDREASKEAEMKNFRERADKAEQELAAAKQNFDNRRGEVEKSLNDTQGKLEADRKKAAADIKSKADEVDKLKKSLANTASSLEEQTTKINNMTRTIVDIPDAEIRYVNQRGGVVWINVGRADGLQPLMTFSVYPADITDLSKGANKGIIEVTQLLGPHMAEARITDDTITDPIMPGDKADTALWNPGEQLHFALAGLMDVNGDNQNDLELVKNLIAMNGGIVDAYEDEKGRVHGLDDMSINTRFLVKGSEGAKEASVATLADGLTKLGNKAKELGVQEITLHTLLQRMGYKAPVSTKATGVEANTYRPPQPKPGSLESRTKNLDQFRPRHPSTENGGGAY